MELMFVMVFVLTIIKNTYMKTGFSSFNVFKVSVISIRSLLTSKDGFLEISNT